MAWSLPTRERGLKYSIPKIPKLRREVAPHAGARIEMTAELLTANKPRVAPHAGARIEIWE